VGRLLVSFSLFVRELTVTIVQIGSWTVSNVWTVRHFGTVELCLCVSLPASICCVNVTLDWRNKKVKVKVTFSRYRLDVAQKVGRGIALLFHDRGTRRWWVVSSTPRPQFTPGKDSVPIVQETGWTPGPVWTGGKSLPNRDSIPDRPTRSQSLYRLSYRAHKLTQYDQQTHMYTICSITYIINYQFVSIAFAVFIRVTLRQ